LLLEVRFENASAAELTKVMAMPLSLLRIPDNLFESSEADCD
jgi:hypothetical protein